MKTVLLISVTIQYVFGRCVTPSIQQSDSQVFLTDQNGDLDYAQEQTYKVIHCCAHNFYKLIWYFKKTGESKWQKFPWFPIDYTSDMQPSLKDNNQTLEIKRIGFNNNGTYRCDALSTDNTVIDQHTTDVIVYSCLERNSPVAYGPINQYGNVGQSVTFKCVGDFGCNVDSTRDVSWYDENWDDLGDITQFPRYRVNEVERENNTTVEVRFTIMTIKEEDFSKNFTCSVTSSYEPGNRDFMVKVFKRSTHIQEQLAAGQIAGILFSLAFVFLIPILFIVLFRPRIKLFILSRLPCGYLKILGDKSYHVLILHDDVASDTNFARDLKNQLKPDGYNVKVWGDILGGQGIIESIQGIAEQSRSLIIIYPSEIITDTFERLLGAQQYFSPNLITVVKTREKPDNTVPILEDRSLVKLVRPTTKTCGMIYHKNFICKLKLRMPKAFSRNKSLDLDLERTMNGESEGLVV